LWRHGARGWREAGAVATAKISLVMGATAGKEHELGRDEKGVLAAHYRPGAERNPLGAGSVQGAPSGLFRRTMGNHGYIQERDFHRKRHLPA
jgi:hypothetical protein